MHATPQEKRKPRVGLIVTLTVVAVLLIALVAVGLYVRGDIVGGAQTGETIFVDVPQGASTSQIASILEEAGVIKSSLIFRAYSRVQAYDGKYQYGQYAFTEDVPYEQMCQTLMTQGTRAQTVKVTIPEGTGINDYVKDVNGEDVTVPGIATLLETAGVCTKSEFFAALDAVSLDSPLLSSVSDKAYYALEGYLFPETYDFYAYDSTECARLAVERMLEETDKRFTEDMRKRAQDMGYSIHEILTMASIIQMESGQNAAEMPNVAAVFYNRLDSNSFSTLGSSPTCYYGDSFTQDDGRYNTYNVPGLPPGPMCSPGIAAIEAALSPAENSPYFYFVTDSSGKFYFHKTSAEQQQTINSLMSSGKWIYEYFN